MTLEISPKKDVHFNVYGYSSLISGLKVNLSAIARDYSICYCIDKSSILEAIYENEADFEYYHAIRSKIEEAGCKESFEAPKIRNSKEHFMPHIYFLVKRLKRQRDTRQGRKFI